MLNRYRCNRLHGKIAADFAEILRGWFNEKYPPPLNLMEWEKMCMMNKSWGNSDCCASHNWFDANVAMSEAMEKNGVPVFGEDGNQPPSQKVEEVWGKSWKIAKRRYLS